MPEYDGPGRRAGSRTGDVRQTPGKPAARRTVRCFSPDLNCHSSVPVPEGSNGHQAIYFCAVLLAR